MKAFTLNPVFGLALAAACGGTGANGVSVDHALRGYTCPQSGDNTVSTLPANNTYVLTSFGGGGAGDSQGQMACNGAPADGLSYYIADGQRFGCGTRLRVTNLATGASCVGTVEDVGPNVCVEEAANSPVLDASPLFAQSLFNENSAGWSDGFMITAVETTDPVGCGTVATPSGSASAAVADGGSSCVPDGSHSIAGDGSDCCDQYDSPLNSCTSAGGLNNNTCISINYTCAPATDDCCDQNANCQTDGDGTGNSYCCIGTGIPSTAGDGSDCCSFQLGSNGLCT